MGSKSKLQGTLTLSTSPRVHDKPQSTKSLCTICNKKVTNKGLTKHMLAVHGTASPTKLRGVNRL